MAYNVKGLRRFDILGFVGNGAGSVKTLWGYTTNDDAATVEATGYFDAMIDQFQVGDQVLASLDLDGTPVKRSYLISSVTTHVTLKRAGITDSSGGTAGTTLASTLAKRTLIMPIPLFAGLANSQVYKLEVPFAFSLTKIGVRVGVPVTTAAKAATLTAQINGVAVTGGVVSLTSAAATPTGTLVAGSSITAANTGTAGQTVEAAVSAVTAFVEGGGWIEFGVTNLDLANAIASLAAAVG